MPRSRCGTGMASSSFIILLLSQKRCVCQITHHFLSPRRSFSIVLLVLPPFFLASLHHLRPSSFSFTWFIILCPNPKREVVCSSLLFPCFPDVFLPSLFFFFSVCGEFFVRHAALEPDAVCRIISSPISSHLPFLLCAVFSTFLFFLSFISSYLSSFSLLVFRFVELGWSVLSSGQKRQSSPLASPRLLLSCLWFCALSLLASWFIFSLSPLFSFSFACSSSCTRTRSGKRFIRYFSSLLFSSLLFSYPILSIVSDCLSVHFLPTLLFSPLVSSVHSRFFFFFSLVELG